LKLVERNHNAPERQGARVIALSTRETIPEIWTNWAGVTILSECSSGEILCVVGLKTLERMCEHNAVAVEGTC
jgi:hypothetical protein